ncbi:hypothetical protein C8Q77DRAFT_1101258 [Trametes polyzona]|nr:hypothetical protein C8Q77DRAFT_1101258 [Trametes polyzona]
MHTHKDNFVDLLFPKRFVLRYNTKGERKNWHAYRSAVEAFLHLRGLECHLRDGTPSDALYLDEKERKRWETDDKLCVSVISLNIKGEPPEDFGRMCEEGRPAASLWEKLHTEDHAVARGGRRKGGDDDLFVKVLISCAFGGFLLMGLIMFVRAPPEAFLPSQNPRY